MLLECFIFFYLIPSLLFWDLDFYWLFTLHNLLSVKNLLVSLFTLFTTNCTLTCSGLSFWIFVLQLVLNVRFCYKRSNLCYKRVTLSTDAFSSQAFQPHIHQPVILISPTQREQLSHALKSFVPLNQCCKEPFSTSTMLQWDWSMDHLISIMLIRFDVSNRHEDLETLMLFCKHPYRITSCVTKGMDASTPL